MNGLALPVLGMPSVPPTFHHHTVHNSMHAPYHKYFPISNPNTYMCMCLHTYTCAKTGEKIYKALNQGNASNIESITLEHLHIPSILVFIVIWAFMSVFHVNTV